jgi:hypothetical protein
MPTVIAKYSREITAFIANVNKLFRKYMAQIDQGNPYMNRVINETLGEFN